MVKKLLNNVKYHKLHQIAWDNTVIVVAEFAECIVVWGAGVVVTINSNSK